MDIPTLQTWLDKLQPTLAAALTKGIRLHVKSLRARGIDFYGYALLPGERHNIPSIVAVTNTEADLKCPPDDDDYVYYRYSVDEWAHWEHDGFTAANALLEKSNARFAAAMDKIDDDDFADELGDIYSEALLALRCSEWVLEREKVEKEGDLERTFSSGATTSRERMAGSLDGVQGWTTAVGDRAEARRW